METTAKSKKSNAGRILVLSLILLVLVSGALAGFTVYGKSNSSEVLTMDLAEPLGDAVAAKYDFNTGTGNLSIDSLPVGEKLLASGSLQYLETQGRPDGKVDMNQGLYTLMLKAVGGRQPGFQLPWSACNGETDWQMHLNPSLPSDINAYSGGGNIQLDLAGMSLNNLAVDTAGGNVDIILPDYAAELNLYANTSAGNVTITVGSHSTGSSTLTASSGAGNVVVRLPEGLAARILATTGMGKVNIDPLFQKIDDQTFQSPGYLDALDKIEIKLEGGAGDVTIEMISG